MYESILCQDTFWVRYVIDQYKAQQMCDEAVNDCLSELTFVPNWLVATKPFTYLYVDEKIL